MRIEQFAREVESDLIANGVNPNHFGLMGTEVGIMKQFNSFDFESMPDPKVGMVFGIKSERVDGNVRFTSHRAIVDLNGDVIGGSDEESGGEVRQ